MKLSTLALFTLVVGATRLAQAKGDACETEIRNQISFAYREGGLSILNIIGPIQWNESIKDKKGNVGLASKMAFAVHYKADPEIIPHVTEGKVLITAECEHGEPRKAVDKNGDGAFTLADAETRGNTGNK